MARSVRNAVLHGTKEAARVHTWGRMKDSVTSFTGRIDVFESIVERDIPLIFRPLNSLLGAFIPAETPGIIVSTERPLAIQRFTAAHELGHALMGHNASIGKEDILARSPFLDADYDLQEVEADAFAAEFLMPYWLLMHHAQRKGWDARSMESPPNVYQLALRLGTSYQATCLALERHNVISANIKRALLSVERRSIKQSYLEHFTPDNWYADVWELTDADQGIVIEGGSEDIFVIRLREKTGSGYIWNTDQLKESGFAIVEDRRENRTEHSLIGGDVSRIISAQSHEPQEGDFDLRLIRPWSEAADAIKDFRVNYNLAGKERGLPRAARKRLEAA